MLDHLKMECGVFGVTNLDNHPAFPYIYWGLRAQNNRGHQSHGFLTYTKDFHVHKGLDLVPKIRRKEIQEWLERLPGNVGIGNVRYSTSGKLDEESLIKGTQPFTAEKDRRKLALSFNGNVVNTVQLKEEITETFPEFSYECDAELICRKLLIELIENDDMPLAIKNCMKEIEGAFSVTAITQNGELFAFKDPCGIRPLCAGSSNNKITYAFSSETVGLDINGLEFNFEVEPGEYVLISEKGFERKQLVKPEKRALCAFEFAYFARPDSKLGKKFVYEVREAFGRNLAEEYSDIVRNADIIISMPETGDDIALGLHEATGIRWERALRRHRYVTERAFMLLPQERYDTIGKKINILGSKINGKNVILTEDSIVRGDTTKVIVKKLRAMGAKRIYLFITFPRIIGPCFYGIDMATYGELIGSKYNAEQIAEIIGADAVCYQSIDRFAQATGLSINELCFACANGNYPTQLAQKLAKRMREQFDKGYVEKGRIYELADLIKNELRDE
jgi:amidophosphoribosyltransferase